MCKEPLFASADLQLQGAETHTCTHPHSVVGPGPLSVSVQSTKTASTSPPGCARVPVITGDLCGGVPCSLQGATASQGQFLYSCCAAPEGTAARSTGLLLRTAGNSRKGHARKQLSAKAVATSTSKSTLLLLEPSICFYHPTPPQLQTVTAGTA